MRRVDGACPREPHERSSLSFHWLRNHEERLLHLASRRSLHPFAARVLLLAARVLLYLCRLGRPPLLLRPRQFTPCDNNLPVQARVGWNDPFPPCPFSRQVQLCAADVPSHQALTNLTGPR